MNYPRLFNLKTLAACGALILAQAATAQSNIPRYITDAVASDERTPAMTERDPARMPAEVLALSEIEPGDTVVEFAGIGQYYTTMLSDIIGPEGDLQVYDLPYTDQFAGEASRAFDASHPNMTYNQGDYNDIELPDNVDVVFNVLYYHDLFLNDIDVDALNEKIFNALKPGGVFLIIDHNAEPGSGTRDTESIHRIDPEVIKEGVLAAGFELEVESDLLRHPEDDLGAMVFSPGTRGATDRSVFKFVKP